MFKTALRSFFTLKPKRNPEADKKVSVILSILIVLTQLGDYASTKLGLTLGAVEANGGMAKFIHNYGYDSFLYLKLAASAFLIWTCWKRPLAASIIILIYAAVIVHNTFTTIRLVG
jgi:hypothetical protein